MASLGAFEHFCSPGDYEAGRQEDIYRGLFAHVAGLLPERSRFYLQTMVFGRSMIGVEQIDRHAPRDSDAWYLAMMGAAFPGSWLPFGSEQVERCAEPHFRLVSSQSGRVDYLETIRQWDKRTERWTRGSRCSSCGSSPRGSRAPTSASPSRRAATPRTSSASSASSWTTSGLRSRRSTPDTRASAVTAKDRLSAENRPWREKSEAAQG